MVATTTSRSIATLSILVGVLYVIFGLFRLGFVARFFAKPVLDGFIIGLGIFIAVGQLHKVVGLPSESGDTIEEAWNVIRHVGDWNGTTTLVGVGALVLLFGLERISKKIPGAVAVVVIGLIVSNAADLSDDGVKVVGNVPSGFSFVSWSSISVDNVIDLVPGALGIIVVGFAQSIAITKALAAETGEKVNANQEMVGYGMASIGAGLSRGTRRRAACRRRPQREMQAPSHRSPTSSPDVSSSPRCSSSPACSNSCPRRCSERL